MPHHFPAAFLCSSNSSILSRQVPTALSARPASGAETAHWVSTHPASQPPQGGWLQHLLSDNSTHCSLPCLEVTTREDQVRHEEEVWGGRGLAEKRQESSNLSPIPKEGSARSFRRLEASASLVSVLYMLLQGTPSVQRA